MKAYVVTGVPPGAQDAAWQRGWSRMVGRFAAAQRSVVDSGRAVGRSRCHLRNGV